MRADTYVCICVRSGFACTNYRVCARLSLSILRPSGVLCHIIPPCSVDCALRRRVRSRDQLSGLHSLSHVGSTVPVLPLFPLLTLSFSLDDLSTLAYASEHPFAVVPCARNMSQVCFTVNATGHGPLVTPEEVGVQVLKHLLKVTAEFLGHNQVSCLPSVLHLWADPPWYR